MYCLVVGSLFLLSISQTDDGDRDTLAMLAEASSSNIFTLLSYHKNPNCSYFFTLYCQKYWLTYFDPHMNLSDTPFLIHMV